MQSVPDRLLEDNDSDYNSMHSDETGGGESELIWFVTPDEAEHILEGEQILLHQTFIKRLVIKIFIFLWPTFTRVMDCRNKTNPCRIHRIQFPILLYYYSLQSRHLLCGRTNLKLVWPVGLFAA